MITFAVSLPESMKGFLEEQATKEGLENISVYLQKLIHEEEKKKAKEKLDSLLLAGLSSPVIGMTDQEWEELEQRVCGPAEARAAP